MAVRNEKLYHIFYGMKQRCYNSKNPKYYLYGGKGIIICDEWNNDYQCFKKWSYDNGYKENNNLSIDRIDSNKNYCPDNCQWISISENSAKANRGLQKNKSKNGNMYAIDKDGTIIEITNVSDFCRQYNLTRSSVSHILNGITKTTNYKEWEFFRISN